jgi:hypothetical protein
MYAVAFFFQSVKVIIQGLTIIIMLLSRLTAVVDCCQSDGFRLATRCWEGTESSKPSHCAWLLLGQREIEACYGRLPCGRI